MSSLTPRKETILRAVVVEYIRSAEPVGSNLIVEKYQLGVGPATVRHELAEMSERGYLEQPHTSAGRIPSDIGYRYYVDRLAQLNLESSDVRKVKEILKNEATTEELLLQTTQLLSRLTQHVSLAATIREQGIAIRQVSITGLTPQRALMIVLLNTGEIENRLIEASPDLTLDDLHSVSEIITKEVEATKLRSIIRKTTPQSDNLKPSAQALLSKAWKSLKRLCSKLSVGKVITGGTNFLIAQPEFQKDLEALSEIVSALEDEHILQDAIQKTAEVPRGISIGKENEQDLLKRLAVIATKFYVEDEEAGTIAIIGPTRMDYERTIPLVENAAKSLSLALSKLLK